MSTGLRFDDQASRQIEGIYMSPNVTARRRAAMEALDPRPGERVLDIGSGPGFMTSEMAAVVGQSGWVCAVDNSESMLAMAKSRLANQPVAPWVEFRLGDATRLPAPDHDFDMVVALQVYEYVSDVQKALSEAYRVLRPGGRLAIIDTDWDSIVWHSTDHPRMQRILEVWNEHLAGDPYLPRTLAAKLREAGFTLQKQRVIVQFGSEQSEAYSHGLTGLIAAFVAGRKDITQQAVSAWIDDLQKLSDEGNYFFSLNQYLFMAIKA